MSNHLDGTYYTVNIRNEDSAYFLPLEEGKALDTFLQQRDSMDPQDRSTTFLFTDLAGLRTRIFIDVIAALQLSTPAQRHISREITHELIARNIDL